MKTVKSFNVQIWIGLKEGYNGIENPIEKVYEICKKYVNENQYCVTVSETNFFYHNGSEKGVVLGLINYARFPSSKKIILKHAFQLGNILMKELNQYRISITTPKKSYLLENKNYESNTTE